ncbi:hypothetical protein DXG03_004162 [Asterophora parasitica]|uniref:DJ-1/PfpI domain-containing protein n=1 Tax=Asterophora parasitica TaxID=117018 RepID=A0A9P7KAE6_9AGAR|nr:hypothetical protein DXG03_004162 [Asterophora parasitica]
MRFTLLGLLATIVGYASALQPCNQNGNQPKLRRDGRHVTFGIIAFHGHQALDILRPLDTFNTLVFAFNVPLNLSFIAETLDPVSTRPRNLAAPPISDFDESIVPTHTYDNAPPLDVLIVLGGRGTRDAEAMQLPIDFIAKVYPSLQYLITVCTGAGVAARAGVLDGKRATTNKRSWASTIALREQVK